MANTKYIYSESDNRMIKYGFRFKYSYSDVVFIGTEHFTWCEDDEVYYSDDIDGKYFEEYQTESPYIDYRGFRKDFIWDTI